MRKILIILAVATFLSINDTGVSSFCNAQLLKSENEGIETILKQLENPDWEERAKVMYHYKLKRFVKDERIKVALISLLEEENKLFNTFFDYDRYDELQVKKYWVYYRNLRDEVALLRDERAIPAVVNSYNWGQAVVHVLEEMGELAVAPLIEKLNSKYSVTKKYDFSIIRILEKIVERHSLSNESKVKIKEVFIKALKDEEPYVRKYAVRGLGHIEDTDVIPLIKSLAKNDPCEQVEMVEGRKKKIYLYPVREEAKKVLKKLKEQQ